MSSPLCPGLSLSLFPSILSLLSLGHQKPIFPVGSCCPAQLIQILTLTGSDCCQAVAMVVVQDASYLASRLCSFVPHPVHPSPTWPSQTQPSSLMQYLLSIFNLRSQVKHSRNRGLRTCSPVEGNLIYLCSLSGP